MQNDPVLKHRIGGLGHNPMTTQAPAENKGIAPSEQCRRDELRSQYEGFEFRVPAAGKVLVTNISYEEDEKEDHRYVVCVDDGFVESCTCPHHQHRDAFCKHMRATEDREAVLLAASMQREGL